MSKERPGGSYHTDHFEKGEEMEPIAHELRSLIKNVDILSLQRPVLLTPREHITDVATFNEKLATLFILSKRSDLSLKKPLDIGLLIWKPNKIFYAISDRELTRLRARVTHGWKKLKKDT